MTTAVTLPDGSRVNFPDDMSHDDMVSAIDQHLNQSPQSPQSPPPSGPVSAAQGWLQQITAAQQGTSPVVRDAQGNLNYTRLGDPIDTDAGPGFIDSAGKWQITDPSRHVVLTDPATSRTGVFERNQETEESRAASLGRMASLGVLSGSPAVVAGSQAPGDMAKVLASSPVKATANLATGALGGGVASHFGLSPEVATLLGGYLGFPHGGGGGMGGQLVESLAKWLGARPASAAPVVNYAAPRPVPGLLGNTLGFLGGAEGAPY